MPGPTEYSCDGWRRGGAGGKQADSRLRAKAVLASAIGNARRGQAWGWGNDESEEAEGETSKIRI